MLEIGAFDPMWADIHMGPDGAVRSFQAMGGAGLMMPIHWGLFSLALHAWRHAQRMPHVTRDIGMAIGWRRPQSAVMDSWILQVRSCSSRGIRLIRRTVVH